LIFINTGEKSKSVDQRLNLTLSDNNLKNLVRLSLLKEQSNALFYLLLTPKTRWCNKTWNFFGCDFDKFVSQEIIYRVWEKWINLAHDRVGCGMGL